MLMRKILDREDPILRQKAVPVPLADIAGHNVQTIIREMIDAMSLQKDGVAIAAPQIGVSSQIFVVSGSLLKQADASYKGEPTELVFINPEIIKMSKEKKSVEEGCLSVRWFYGKVRRSVRVTLRAYNEKGQRIERGASGLLAQIFQHEVDHLNGILFTDKAKEVWQMTTEEIEELQRK
ncbi:MAG: peptide deformylase [Patescibacteria group bacterium]|nr:peptide deformylase [Patescibacteria group bacterium]MDE2172619.1 peptide deformylase [Patescibacteria group bacterium]